jgi:hypothetical protein
VLSTTTFASGKRFSEESVDANDIATIRKSFRADETEPKLRDRAKRAVDGAYNYSFDISRRKRKYSDDPVVQRELELKAMLCNSDALAVVVARGAKPFLNPARSMVYTKYRLQVVDIIASNTPATNSSQLPAIMSGGEAADSGEKFRVKNLDSPELQPEETYVVFLNELEDRRLFHVMEAIPVRDKRIYPNKGEFGGLSAGMALDEMTTAAQKVRATYCPNLGAK